MPKLVLTLLASCCCLVPATTAAPICCCCCDHSGSCRSIGSSSPLLRVDKMRSTVDMCCFWDARRPAIVWPKGGKKRDGQGTAAGGATKPQIMPGGDGLRSVCCLCEATGHSLEPCTCNMFLTFCQTAPKTSLSRLSVVLPQPMCRCAVVLQYPRQTTSHRRNACSLAQHLKAQKRDHRVGPASSKTQT